MPGAGCGSRVIRLPPQDSTATAPAASGHPAPPANPATMTIAAELNPVWPGRSHLSPCPGDMAWRKRRSSDDGASESLGPLEISTSGSGVIIEGSPTAVSALVDQMLEAAKEVGGRSRHFVADGVQVAANISAFRQTHREYFEFSERARKLLKEHGAIATKDGYYRSFVHNGRELAGNLDWKSVALGPEQA